MATEVPLEIRTHWLARRLGTSTERARQQPISSLVPASPLRAVRSGIVVVERGIVVAFAGTLAEVRRLLNAGRAA